MQHLLTAINVSLVEQNWYAALSLTLALPDICGWLEDPSPPSQDRYVSWFDRFVAANYESARHQATSLVPSASSEHSRQVLIVQRSVTGWRSLIAGTGLCLVSCAHSATTHFNSSDFIGFLLHPSPPTLHRTARWGRQVFSAKVCSNITTSSTAFASMQLSMDAFLTPTKTPNQLMKQTAPLRNAFSVFATTPCRGLALSR
jgi:hypothetical protein